MTNDDYDKIKQLFESGNVELSFALSESVGSTPVKFMSIFVGEKVLNDTGFDLWGYRIYLQIGSANAVNHWCCYNLNDPFEFDLEVEFNSDSPDDIEQAKIEMIEGFLKHITK